MFSLPPLLVILLIPLAWGQRNNAPQISTAQDQCNKTVGIYEEVTSPAVTPENYGKPMLCHYRFRPFRTNLRDWVLRLRFTKFKIGRIHNNTACETGYVQIIDGNAPTTSSKKGKGTPGFFCGEIESPQTFISETSSVRLVFYVNNFTDQSYFRFDSRAEQQYEVYLRYGQHPELYPNRRGEVVPNTYCERVFRDCRMQTCYVQSPGYPGLYPRNLFCKYYINTRLPFIKLHIENEEFNVDGQRCENLMTCPLNAISDNCPHDYLRVYDGKDEKAPLIGTFCGIGKFPFSIIGTGSDLYVEFVTAPSGPLSGNTGFHFNVGHWPGHVETSGKSNGTCDWLFTSKALQESGDKQGLFWSVSHYYPANTKCSYLMLGEKDEIVRLLFPSFRIDKINSAVKPFDGECGESLTIYDASFADDSRIIKTFCDTSRPLEKYDFVSTGNALFVLFESKTGSYAGSSLYYWSTYDFFNNSHYGELIPGTACDELFAPWGASGQSGRFTSPLNTLIYKNEDGKVISCRYRFVTKRRMFGRILLKIDNVNFKYNQDNCLNCAIDRVDKVIMGDGNKSLCICKENAHPMSFVSQGEEAEIVMKIDPRHAIANYFKSPAPIFTGSFQFIHGPLCGPSLIGPSPDGKLRFPFYYNPALRDQPVHCLWELRVTGSKDLFLFIQKLTFAAKSCSEAKLDLFLPQSTTGTGSNKQQASSSSSPLLTLCGDQAPSSQISTQLPIIPSEKLTSPVTIQLTATSMSKLNFIISWTELHQLPKNPDGTLKTAKLEDCGFLCPGPQGICISRALVCNGIQNCPNISSGAHDESPDQCSSINENQFVVLNYHFNVSWVSASLVGGGVALLLCIFCCCLIKCCCGGRKVEREEDYLT